MATAKKTAKTEDKAKAAPAAQKSAEAKPAKAAKAGASAKAGPAKPESHRSETKFAGFIGSKKLDPRRILIASRKLEANRPEDRLIRLKKRLARGADGAQANAENKETRKPRSGRPVTHRALHAAITGGKLSGPTKTRLVRAINHLLEQKKQEQITMRELF